MEAAAGTSSTRRVAAILVVLLGGAALWWLGGSGADVPAGNGGLAATMASGLKQTGRTIHDLRARIVSKMADGFTCILRAIRQP